MNGKSGTRKFQRVPVWLAVAALLPVLAASAPGARGAHSIPRPQAAAEAQNLLAREKSQAEEARAGRETEARDREQEKKEREQEKAERLQELYDGGREALDEEEYAQAAQKFAELAQLKGPQTDAALYWKAFAENKQGKRDGALSTIAELKNSFPQSRWKKDAEALEIEVRQGTGQPVNPESTNDAELRALALQGIMNSDSQRGIQIIEKNLNGTASPKEKAKYLFILAQSGSPEAMEVLVRTAREGNSPELQRKAVEYLGIFGGKRSSDALADIYAKTNDAGIKHAVMRSYFISGNRERLTALAKSETHEELKREAIRSLGLAGGHSELQQLYQTETSVEVKKEILQALFLSGDSQKLAQAAQEEKNPELRRAAVRSLGLIGAKSPELQSIYARETDRGVKEEVLNAYFIGGNAAGLVAIARSEKDAGLKKEAVGKLSLMGSKEANDYLMEILQK